MSNPVQPSVLPIWTEGNTAVRTQPTDGEQFAGFVPNFRPPASWHNWLFGIMSDWIAWLNFVSSPVGQTQTATTAPASPVGNPIRTFFGNPVGGSFAVALASAAANAGMLCAFKNISATNTLTVTVQTGNALEGVTNGTTVLNPGESVILASDGVSGFWQVNS